MNESRTNSRLCRGCLQKSLAAYDFALLEMNLYLDTHPQDTEALELVQVYRQKRAELIDLYESRYGAYVVTPADVEGTSWTWVNDPWPWDYAEKE